MKYQVLTFHQCGKLSVTMCDNEHPAEPHFRTQELSGVVDIQHITSHRTKAMRITNFLRIHLFTAQDFETNWRDDWTRLCHSFGHNL